LVTFVDSSAFYAYLDARDGNHQLARSTLTQLIETRDDLVTNNYVVVESSALIQRRLGAQAVLVFLDDIVPVVRISWIDESMHRLATAAMLASLNRGVSLVDHASFVTMRRLGIQRAFAFDADFGSQGFELIPAP
jgi:predicted nucleic acid-binding protein